MGEDSTRPAAAPEGGCTVREAGRRGGRATSERHGAAFFSEIGKKGGGKVREMIRRGQAAEKAERDE
jgi:general stress protein YciG